MSRRLSLTVCGFLSEFYAHWVCRQSADLLQSMPDRFTCSKNWNRLKIVHKSISQAGVLWTDRSCILTCVIPFPHWVYVGQLTFKVRYSKTVSWQRDSQTALCVLQVWQWGSRFPISPGRQAKMTVRASSPLLWRTHRPKTERVETSPSFPTWSSQDGTVWRVPHVRAPGGFPEVTHTGWGWSNCETGS